MSQDELVKRFDESLFAGPPPAELPSFDGCVVRFSRNTPLRSGKTAMRENLVTEGEKPFVFRRPATPPKVKAASRVDMRDEIIDFDPGVLRYLRKKTMGTMREEAIEWLERERGKADANLKRAEQKSGVTDEEIQNLLNKIIRIDYALLCVTLS